MASDVHKGPLELIQMILDVSANRITFVRFALNFNEILMILVDFTKFTAESNMAFSSTIKATT